MPQPCDYNAVITAWKLRLRDDAGVGWMVRIQKLVTGVQTQNDPGTSSVLATMEGAFTEYVR
jgi:hypothetical protein